MKEKDDKLFYLRLALLTLFSIVLTWGIIIISQPSLTPKGLQVWTGTLEEAKYRGKININHATVEQLTLAEGVGSATAEKIYEYIHRYGPVRSIDQLDAVDGVGEKRIDALKKIFVAS